MDTSEWENKETNRLRANRKKLQELDKKNRQNKKCKQYEHIPAQNDHMRYKTKPEKTR